MSSSKLSAVVCSYNPDKAIVSRVINALKSQTLDYDYWELIIIDNNSSEPLKNNIDIGWHPNSKIIIEKNQGLALARIRGVEEAINELIIFIDDDNVASIDYLEQSLKIFTEHSSVGLFGGKALPNFLEHAPEEWINKYIGLLGCRDLGDDEIISEIQNSMIEEYPYFSPIGTGMCIRKSVFLTYLKEIENNDFRKNLGRKGNALTSGEDNDIVITALKSGWQVGYFPQLQIEHLIPQRRTSRDYLGSMNFAQNKSWIQLLRFHDICPWKPILRWTVPFRKLRSFFINKTWKSKEQLIKWKGCCGLFEALAK